MQIGVIKQKSVVKSRSIYYVPFEVRLKQNECRNKTQTLEQKSIDENLPKNRLSVYIEKIKNQIEITS